MLPLAPENRFGAAWRHEAAQSHRSCQTHCCTSPAAHPRARSARAVQPTARTSTSLVRLAQHRRLRGVRASRSAGAVSERLTRRSGAPPPAALPVAHARRATRTCTRLARRQTVETDACSARVSPPRSSLLSASLPSAIRRAAPPRIRRAASRRRPCTRHRRAEHAERRARAPRSARAERLEATLNSRAVSTAPAAARRATTILRRRPAQPTCTEPEQRARASRRATRSHRRSRTAPKPPRHGQLAPRRAAAG